MKLIVQVVGLVLKTAWVVFVLALPLLAVWLATSLITLHGGPRELAIFGGALLFPVLPLAWELRATRRWRAKLQRRKQLTGTPKRWLSAPKRVVLRTLALNLAFIGVLLTWFPQKSFEALATRGDWYLGDHQEPWAQLLRQGSFGAASGVEWLYALAHENPYKKKGDDVPAPPDVAPTPEIPNQPIARRWIPRTSAWPDAGSPPQAPDAGTPSVRVEVTPEALDAGPPPTEDAWAVGKTTWPWANAPDPVLATMTPSDEQSIETVARFVAVHRSQSFERVKALHDWVVTRLHYDLSTLGHDQQEAQAVFQRRSGVCEGYARLMVALGAASGDRIAFLTGDVREENGEAAPIGHAWNAVQVNGAWYLIDATWDDPTMNDGKQTYRTDYLFIPPSIAVYDHFPDDARWQLLQHPLSRGEFLRQPNARPGLAREGLALLTPERPTVEVDDALDIKLSNPRRVNVMVTLAGAGEPVRCGVDDAVNLSLRCPVAAAGKYRALILGNHERFGTYTSMASIEVIRR